MKYPEQESSILEFKESFPKNDQIIKTIVGFCNQKGGKLLIGVAQDGTILGVPEEEIDAALEYLEKSIYEATTPPLIPIVGAQRIGDKTILVIEVFPGSQKPYYVRSESLDKGTYVRLGRSTVRATPGMIEELRWQSRGKSYDGMPIYHATLQDLDNEAIQSFLENRKGKKQFSNDKEALFAYNLATTEHAQTYPTVAGMLLFGKDPQKFISEAMIICTRFAGIEGRDVLATIDCEGTIVQQYKSAFNFIISQLNRSFTITSSIRDEQLEIPEVAIREALLNAIVHRNYYLKSSIKIAIYNNRVEIFSPGDFPGPITEHTLRMGYTYIRNPSIIKVFRELGFVEKLGTGFLAIFESYEDLGLREPQIIESDNFVKCILPRPTPLDQSIIMRGDETSRILRLFESATELTISDIVLITHIPRATVGRKLAELVHDQIIKKIGTGRSTRYLLNRN
jgi:ATP-dependent DNA helicase RecG